MDRAKIADIVMAQRAFFRQGKTKDLSFRVAQLKLLRKVIADNEDAICTALKLDMNKPTFEAYVGEIAMLANEIDYAIRHLKSWAKPRRVSTPLVHFPAESRIYSEPLGIVLIIGPWNYPIQLVLAPLIGAMAAGDCSILKPSELAPHSARLIGELITENFDPGLVATVQGGAEVVTELLERPFDHIFFTGGASVGRIVAQAAAKHLTPVTLELGGKTPCLLDKEIHVEYTDAENSVGKVLQRRSNLRSPGLSAGTR